MKLSELVNSKNALISLAKQNLPIATAWQLKMFMSEINAEITAFEEIRNSKILSYGQEIEGTKNFSVKPENMEVYFKEINEIAEKEVDVKIPTISMSEIIEYNKGLDKKINISTEDLLILSWLIV